MVSNYWQTNRRLCGKRSHAVRFIKDRNAVLLSNEEDILGRLRESFKKIDTQVKGGKLRNFTITATEVLESNLKCSTP